MDLPESLFGRVTASICGKCGHPSSHGEAFPGGFRCAACIEAAKAAQEALFRRKAAEGEPAPAAEDPFAGITKSIEEFTKSQVPPPAAAGAGKPKVLPKMKIQQHSPDFFLQKIPPEDIAHAPEISGPLAAAVENFMRLDAAINAFEALCTALRKKVTAAIKAAHEAKGVPGWEREAGEMTERINGALRELTKGKTAVATYKNYIIGINKLVRQAPPTKTQEIAAYADTIRALVNDAVADLFLKVAPGIYENLVKAQPKTEVEELVMFPRPKELMEKTRKVLEGPAKAEVPEGHKPKPRKKKEAPGKEEKPPEEPMEFLASVRRGMEIVAKIEEILAVPPADPFSERAAQLRGLWQSLKDWVSSFWEATTEFSDDLDKIGEAVSELKSYVEETA